MGQCDIVQVSTHGQRATAGRRPVAGQRLDRVDLPLFF
jgi:hypothetical protein